MGLKDFSLLSLKKRIKLLNQQGELHSDGKKRTAVINRVAPPLVANALLIGTLELVTTALVLAVQLLEIEREMKERSPELERPDHFDQCKPSDTYVAVVDAVLNGVADLRSRYAA